MRRSQLTNIHAILTSINIYWNVTSTKVKKCAKYFHLSQGVPFLITSDEVRWDTHFLHVTILKGTLFFCARNKFRCSKITKVPRYKLSADLSETKENFRNRLQRNVFTPEFRDTTMIEFIIPLRKFQILKSINKVFFLKKKHRNINEILFFKKYFKFCQKLIFVSLLHSDQSHWYFYVDL